MCTCWHFKHLLLLCPGKIFQWRNQRQRHTHQAMAHIVAKCKNQVLVFGTYRGTISQSFLNSEGHTLGAPAAPHPSTGGRFEAPTPVHTAFKPQCWVSNNDVSPCTYATGSAMTQRESRRVYREVLLSDNTGTV